MMNRSDPSVSLSRVVAYLRKSRADGEESVEEVLAKHEKILQDYAVRTWGAPLPESRLFREVQSGETIAARPVMQKLLGMVQNREIDAVLVVELQRLSRGDLLDVGTLSQIFYFSKCLILTPSRTWNLEDEFDRKFFELELQHGRDYLEYIKRIMTRGRERSAMDGNYIGSRRPYGYERVVVDKKPTLAVVPSEAEVVRLIFELYAGPEHLGPCLIADRLNEMGIRPLRSNAWTRASVRNIVENPLYIGKIRWNRRKSQKQFKDGSIVEIRPVSEDFIFAEGRHEPIISPDLWERAQEAAQTRAHPSARIDRSAIVNPLSGLLVCSACGMMMHYKQCYEHKTHKPLRPIFLCVSGGKYCPTRGAPTADVLEVLAESLRRSLADLPAAEDSPDAADPPSLSARSVFETELSELEKQKERLYDFLERGLYDDETFRHRMAAVTAKIETAHRKLSSLLEKEKTAEEKKQFRTTLQKCIDALSDPESSPEEINKLLKTIILRVNYSREKSSRRKWDVTPIGMEIIFK